MSDDQDLLLRWAAEELLAAGRADDEPSKRAHRRTGEFFVDIGHTLRAGPRAERPATTGIGELLAIAFASPPARHRRG